VRARHSEPSWVLSQDDDASGPSSRLIDVSLRAIQAARTLDLSAISSRIPAGPRYPDVWPGEHYKLLAGFVQTLKPQLVVEIGTYQGLSALSLKHFLSSDAHLMSFDLTPWQEIPGTYLRLTDFEGGHLSHHVDDLTRPEILSRYSHHLKEADFIFVDAAKDGVQEARLLEGLSQINFTRPPLLFFDDTRLLTMLKFWREIRKPKLDLTSFGHWSGSGVVEWS
jgi:hypothetical protein